MVWRRAAGGWRGAGRSSGWRSRPPSSPPPCSWCTCWLRRWGRRGRKTPLGAGPWRGCFRTTSCSGWRAPWSYTGWSTGNIPASCASSSRVDWWARTTCATRTAGLIITGGRRRGLSCSHRSIKERLMAEPSARLELIDNDGARALAGGRSENLRLVEKRLGVHIGQRGNVFLISGEPEKVQLAERLLAQLGALIEKKYPLGLEDVEQASKLLLNDPSADLREIFLDTVYITSRNRPVTPKGFAQKAYIDAIRRYDIVFGIGPAGTGKTYLAMAMAVAALVERRVKRIVLCRPAVEAGEKLGFLPGDLAEKVSPYLRPLYDALHDLMDMDRAQVLLERGTVEVAPLAFMRGRTLNDSFVILDEAQNTTTEQMKMFLTRLGFGSKAVVTGDATQIDLPAGKPSGMNEARKEHRPVLVDTWALWCHTCLSMQRFVFPDPGLRPVKDVVVWLSIDSENPKNNAFLDRVPLDAWPTFLVIEPRGERVVGRWIGAASANDFRAFVQEGARAASGKEKPDAATAELHKGYEARDKGDFAAAAAAYGKALQLTRKDDPARPERLVLLSMALARSKSPEAAR